MVNDFNQKANFIWSIADLIRDTFRRGRYQDVVLPFTVLRRIDQVLEPTKDDVVALYAKYRGRFDEVPPDLLRKASGYAFYNVSPYTFDRLLADPNNLADNLSQYIGDFSPNMRSDLYMKSPSGRDAENIARGSTLSNDQHAGKRFHYLVTNPPYGKDWKMDQEAVEREARRGHVGRFGAGTPRVSDGQLLFLQHMLNRMRSPEKGGGRVAIVMNGSPLFTGDAGSGESEIRRWILENDWLEALIALPEQLFYNTGIATYIWVLSNWKAADRAGRVQLIDATDLWEPMRKSLGDKRRRISAEQIGEITRIYRVGGGRPLPVLRDDRVRLPEGAHRAAGAAQLLRLGGAHPPPEGGACLPEAGPEPEAGPRGAQAGDRGGEAEAGGDPGHAARYGPAGLQGRALVPQRVQAGGEGARDHALRRHARRHRGGVGRAGRDGGDPG
jgi:type I restriction-modification system DNA methylase subunit